MQIRRASKLAALLAVAWTVALGGPVQTPQVPPAGGVQEGRGGRGGGRGPNFPQQQRPPGDPAVVARGQSLYRVHCTSCHGMDLRGGDQGGPNLLRSEAVLTDEKGENILAIVRSGRQTPGMGIMPSFQLPEPDIIAIAEYIHSVMARTGRQGRPPESENPVELNVLVGDPAAGEAYFNKTCSGCHSASRDLEAIGSRIPDPRTLQNTWVAGGRGGGRGGRGGDGEDSATVRVTVTPAAGQAVTGRLVRIDDFIVTLIQDDGARRTFRREGAIPRVEIQDPREAHRRLVLSLTDRDMHNVTAYLATLK
ncbi:MAG: c-type cytochrome [Acidobacteria bacterium]|nr:c-type cytochrome [Acidobacteriota bacterium]